MWIAASVGSQHVVPHSLDVSSQLREPFLRGTIVASGPFPAVAYKPRPAQHSEVLGDAGLADPRDPGELTHGVRAGAQTLEQRAPRRIGERHHYRSIGHALYRHPCMDKSINSLSRAPTARQRLRNW